MRVAIAEFKQETNTFVARPTTMADFETWHYWTGPELIAGSEGTNCEIDGFLNCPTTFARVGDESFEVSEIRVFLESAFGKLVDPRSHNAAVIPHGRNLVQVEPRKIL